MTETTLPLDTHHWQQFFAALTRVLSLKLFLINPLVRSLRAVLLEIFPQLK